MNRIIDLIEAFCNINNEKYAVYMKDTLTEKGEDWNFAIELKGDTSFVTLLTELAEFLEDKNLTEDEVGFAEAVHTAEADGKYWVVFPFLNY